MDKRPDIPRLDPTNYGPWIVATRAAAHTINAIDHITSNPIPPEDTTELTTFHRNKNLLLGKLITSIPPQIANLILTPTSDPTPYDLIQAITSHLDTTNASDHKYLKQLAEQAHYLPDMTLEQYIATHEQIRTRMIAARYPDISNPKTTVEFLIDGLRFNPATAPIGTQLIALDPNDIKDFVHKFNRLNLYRMSTQLRPSPLHGDAGSSNLIRNSAPSTQWYNRTPRRHLAHLAVPKNPCRFHMSRGVLRPRHTDIECNHPAHPRHRIRQPPRAKAYNTARVALGHPEYGHDMAMDMDDTASPVIPDNNCTYILDSGAHPSHVTNLSAIHQPEKINHRTKTATNQIVKCTHTGQTTIKTNKGHTLKVSAVVSPDITSNLLSVRSITQSHGNILFTPQTAYLFDRTSKRKIIGTAPWNNELQAYAWKPTPPHQARGARTTPTTRNATKPGKPTPPKPTPKPRHPNTNTATPPPLMSSPTLSLHTTKSKYTSTHPFHASTTHPHEPLHSTRPHLTQLAPEAQPRPAPHNPKHSQIAHNTRCTALPRTRTQPTLMLRLCACETTTGTPLPHAAQLQHR